MLFTIGVETPPDDKTAFGLIVPALCNDKYGCFSAADTEDDIVPMVTDAIHLILEDMVEDGVDILQLKDLGFRHYKQQEDYDYCDTWLLVDVDVSAYLGKRKRLNITLPEYLINRIDNKVNHSDIYRDRSHFLAVASQRELVQ